MSVLQRFSDWFLELSIRPAIIPGAKGPAFITHAHMKCSVVGGRAACTVVDALLKSRDPGTYTHVVIGDVHLPEVVPSIQVPRRINALEFAASLLLLRPRHARNFRFVDLIYTRAMCLPYRWRRPYVWRTFLIAHYLSLKFRRLARDCTGAYLTSYYNATMLGIVWAFRAADKPVVDIQHGHLGATHEAYSNRAAFRLKSDFQPSMFLVWSQEFGRYLEETLGVAWESTDYLHLRVIPPDESDARRGPAILFTLQYATEFPEQVRAAVHRWPQVSWTFRLHPYQKGLPPELDWLRSMPNASVVGPEEPLALAIRRCDLHITFNSSVVHEAAALGKPSFHMDPTLADRFQVECGQGLAKFVPAPALLAAIDEFLAGRGLKPEAGAPACGPRLTSGAT